MRPATHWNLYLDESGRFDDLADEVVVGGLLVRDDVSSFWTPRLRATLEAELPALPWPLHAWLLNHVGYLLVVGAWRLETWGEARATMRLGRRFVADIRAMLPIARADARDSLMDALTSMHRGREPRKEHLDALEIAVDEGCPGACGVLRDHLVGLRAKVVRILESAASSPGSLPGAVALVGAGEASRGDAAGHEIGDRYLVLLECVVERAASTVAQHPEAAHVWVHALMRNVFEPSLGRDIPLHVSHLAPICERVRANVAPGRVRVVQARTPRFDANVCGALVLADLVANRSRRCLGGRPLARVQQLIRDEVPGPALVTRDGLSHIGSTGEPWAYLRRDGEGEEPVGRQWAVTQALQWVPAWRGPA